MSLSQIPPKGTRDWTPEEFAIRKYIFDTWRQVCTSFGYQEYLTPIVESADLYRAKSGDEIGGLELTTFVDRGGRELAIRPEMTPSVSRMVSSSYATEQKPIRLFSIANFFRNQRPQRGRNREFWQLNYDLFGSDAAEADLEVVLVSLEIMRAFSPPENSFVVKINNRRLIDAVLSHVGILPEHTQAVVRVLDKFAKLSEESFVQQLSEIGLSQEQAGMLQKFLSLTDEKDFVNAFPTLSQDPAFLEISSLLEQLRTLGYGKEIVFAPDVIRGFDYYDGVVFEVFDLRPDNNRSLFGGGRYNGLGGLFGVDFPAVGAAPGDETLRLFLESWGLLDQVTSNVPPLYYAPLLSWKHAETLQKLVSFLRKEQNMNIVIGFQEQSLSKALSWADKRDARFVILFGENEIAKKIYVEKKLEDGSSLEHNIPF
ncbi:MAG: histidine--tRNA ligase [Candidatus Moranbacteria bacterium]|nr:histidine--tRNA ligase [Candidatus Moranbacteria bacterium]